MNCYGCTNPIIRRGFMRGNSTSGQGVMMKTRLAGRAAWSRTSMLSSGAAAVSAPAKLPPASGSGVAGRATASTMLRTIVVAGWPMTARRSRTGRGWVGRLRAGLSISGSEAFFAYRSAPKCRIPPVPVLQPAPLRRGMGPISDECTRVCTGQLHSARPNSSNDALGEVIIVRTYSPPQQRLRKRGTALQRAEPGRVVSGVSRRRVQGRESPEAQLTQLQPMVRRPGQAGVRGHCRSGRAALRSALIETLAAAPAAGDNSACGSRRNGDGAK